MAITFAWFLSVYYYLLDGSLPKGADVKIVKKIKYQAKRLYVDGDGRLLERESSREVLHEGNALEVVTRIHQEGHVGILNTLDKVTRFYALKGAREMVTAVVQNCETCQFRARIKATRSNPATIIKTPRHPFFTISCDAVGPLPITSRKNRYILTGICNLTRFPVAKAVSDINEVTTGEFYFSEVIRTFGVPNYCHTDRGQNFISTYVQHFLKQLGCKSTMTTSYRPQANGMCERLNGSLCSILAKIARDDDKSSEWDLFLDVALMVLRSTVNSGTGYTPSYLLFGYEMKTPSVWVPPRLDYVEGEEETAVVDRVVMIKEKLTGVREEARKKSDERKLLNKKRYDNKVVFRRLFEVGDKVLLKVDVSDSKFGDRWEGPYTILSVNGASGTYYLTGKNSLRIKHPVNGDRLKPYTSSGVARFVPDVLVKEANSQFRRWVQSRKGVVEVNTVYLC